jgi:8-hydroxy-5-deazaflavin:NADPH oxidoreductase
MQSSTSYPRSREQHHQLPPTELELSMKNIGILGSGRVGTALATKLAAAQYTVTVGSLDAAKAAAKWTGPPVRHADQREAARDSSIVINATPGDSSLARLAEMRAELDGKILVDVSNATERGSDGLPGALCYPNSSLAERLQQALPNTRVVKTLNTMLFTVMTNPTSLSTPPTVFVSGNDGEAKATVSSLLVDLGWAPEWIADLGDVTTARGPEALMLLVPSLLARYGFKPFALTIAR